MGRNKTSIFKIDLLANSEASSWFDFGIRKKINRYLYKTLIVMRRMTYLLLYGTNVFFIKNNQQIYIFCYHSVFTDDWQFSVGFEKMKKQVTYLLSKYKPVTLADIKAHLTGGKAITHPSFTITFDDGYKDVLQTKEYFKSLGIRPAVFILSDRNNVLEKELDTKREFLNAHDILELKEAGWDIGCHSATHADFSRLDKDGIKKEIIDAKMNLEKELGMPISYFSYPKGKYSPEILSAVGKAGYTLGVSMDDICLNRTTNLLALPRIGVDNTHTFREFKALHTLPAMLFRRFIKKLF